MVSILKDWLRFVEKAANPVAHRLQLGGDFACSFVDTTQQDALVG